MSGSWLLRFVLRFLIGNKAIMLQVFLLLAEKIVQETDNPLDDQFLELLKDTLGEQDITELKKIVD